MGPGRKRLRWGRDVGGLRVELCPKGVRVGGRMTWGTEVQNQFCTLWILSWCCGEGDLANGRENCWRTPMTI